MDTQPDEVFITLEVVVKATSAEGVSIAEYDKNGDYYAEIVASVATALENALEHTRGNNFHHPMEDQLALEIVRVG